MRQINSTNQCFSSLDFRFVVLLTSYIQSQTCRIPYRNRSKCVLIFIAEISTYGYEIFYSITASFPLRRYFCPPWMSNKLDNAVLRYSKLNLHQLRLLEENLYRTSTTKHCKTGYVRSCYTRQHQSTYRSDYDANAKQWLMSSPNICPFLGIGLGKYLSGCSFFWFSALVYCRRKSYLLSTLRIVCQRVKVLSSRLCSIVASLSASCCRCILTTRQ